MTTLSLYLVTSEPTDYDEYDALLVVAKSPAAAIKVATEMREIGRRMQALYSGFETDRFKKIAAKLVGIAHPSLKEGDVPISSYNAG